MGESGDGSEGLSPYKSLPVPGLLHVEPSVQHSITALRYIMYWNMTGLCVCKNTVCVDEAGGA